MAADALPDADALEADALTDGLEADALPDADALEADVDAMAADALFDADALEADVDALEADALFDADAAEEAASEAGLATGWARPPTAGGPRYPRWGWRRSIEFAVSRGMVTPGHLSRYARYLRHRARNPGVEFEGMAFLDRGAELYAPRGTGRLVIGPWCWVGAWTSVRAHEGSVRLGAKAVLGRNNVVNGYLDIEIGAEALLSDWIYVCDFDHRFDDLAQPIRKQGLRMTPVRIGEDVWVGEKCSVLRGADVGAGSVIGSQSVIKGRIPPFSIAAGAPARVIRSRLPDGMTPEEALDLRRRGRPIPGDPLT